MVGFVGFIMFLFFNGLYMAAHDMRGPPRPPALSAPPLWRSARRTAWPLSGACCQYPPGSTGLACAGAGTVPSPRRGGKPNRTFTVTSFWRANRAAGMSASGAATMAYRVTRLAASAPLAKHLARHSFTWPHHPQVMRV